MSDTLTDVNHVADDITKTVSTKTKRWPFIHKLVNKRNLLITTGALVLLIIFVFGMVQQVKAERHDKAVQAAQAANYNDLKTENANLKQRVGELEASNNFNTARAANVCDWVKSVAPKYRLTVPPLCKN